MGAAHWHHQTEITTPRRWLRSHHCCGLPRLNHAAGQWRRSAYRANVLVGYPQPSPQLGANAAEQQNPIAVVVQQLQQPVLQSFSLGSVAPVADQIHSATQFADADRRGGQRPILMARFRKKVLTPGFARSPLRASLITWVSTKYIYVPVPA